MNWWNSWIFETPQREALENKRKEAAIKKERKKKEKEEARRKEEERKEERKKEEEKEKKEKKKKEGREGKKKKLPPTQPEESTTSTLSPGSSPGSDTSAAETEVNATRRWEHRPTPHIEPSGAGGDLAEDLGSLSMDDHGSYTEEQENEILNIRGTDKEPKK